MPLAGFGLGGYFSADGKGAGAGQQRLRHFFDGQHMGGVTRLNGAGRHAVIFGRGRFLYQRDSAGAEDGA